MLRQQIKILNDLIRDKELIINLLQDKIKSKKQ